MEANKYFFVTIKSFSLSLFGISMSTQRAREARRLLTRMWSTTKALTLETDLHRIPCSQHASRGYKQYLQVTYADKLEQHSPCPNLMQIRSSTMHIARESQQKDPTFLNGLLKTIIRQLLFES